MSGKLQIKKKSVSKDFSDIEIDDATPSLIALTMGGEKPAKASEEISKGAEQGQGLDQTKTESKTPVFKAVEVSEENNGKIGHEDLNPLKPENQKSLVNNSDQSGKNTEESIGKLVKGPLKPVSSHIEPQRTKEKKLDKEKVVDTTLQESKNTGGRPKTGHSYVTDTVSYSHGHDARLKKMVYNKKMNGDPFYSKRQALEEALDMLFEKNKKYLAD